MVGTGLRYTEQRPIGCQITVLTRAAVYGIENNIRDDLVALKDDAKISSVNWNLVLVVQDHVPSVIQYVHRQDLESGAIEMVNLLRQLD